MTRFTVLSVVFVGLAIAGIAYAGPLRTSEGTSEVAETSTTAIAVVDTLTEKEETGLATTGDADGTTAVDVAGETHIRQKRSCGCCCCRPCCCCCRPCCCCCKPCCCCCKCCCRCCCCCCRPCCCCRQCCCCRPCCGCCGCGGRKRRAIADLSHKLMDQQIAAVRASSAESTDIVVATTEAVTATTVAPINAAIDAFGRTYSDLAFADFTNNVNSFPVYGTQSNQ